MDPSSSVPSEQSGYWSGYWPKFTFQLCEKVIKRKNRKWNKQTMPRPSPQLVSVLVWWLKRTTYFARSTPVTRPSFSVGTMDSDESHCGENGAGLNELWYLGEKWVLKWSSSKIGLIKQCENCLKVVLLNW